MSLGIRKKRRRNGLLIAIEGIDQSGKATQSRLLAGRIRREGYSVEVVDFPNYGTRVGRLLKEYLAGNALWDHHAIHLLYAANQWESANQIREKLKEG